MKGSYALRKQLQNGISQLKDSAVILDSHNNDISPTLNRKTVLHLSNGFVDNLNLLSHSQGEGGVKLRGK